jgi:hypothetical protein
MLASPQVLIQPIIQSVDLAGLVFTEAASGKKSRSVAGDAALNHAQNWNFPSGKSVTLPRPLN